MDSTVTMFFIYKTILLLVGFATIYLGYKLFIKGFIDRQGEMSAEHKGFSLKFKQFAPGSFFCLLGTCIILYSTVKEFTHNKPTADGTESTAANGDSASKNHELDSVILISDSIALPPTPQKNKSQRVMGREEIYISVDSTMQKGY